MPPPKVNNTDKVWILVVGPGTWGRGETLDEALKAAQKPSRYAVYVAHRDTWVDEFGAIVSPRGWRPRKIWTRGLGGTKNEKKEKAKARPRVAEPG